MITYYFETHKKLQNAKLKVVPYPSYNPDSSSSIINYIIANFFQN